MKSGLQRLSDNDFAKLHDIDSLRLVHSYGPQLGSNSNCITGVRENLQWGVGQEKAEDGFGLLIHPLELVFIAGGLGHLAIGNKVMLVVDGNLFFGFEAVQECNDYLSAESPPRAQVVSIGTCAVLTCGNRLLPNRGRDNVIFR